MTPDYNILLSPNPKTDTKGEAAKLKDITDNLRTRLISLNVIDSSDDSADACKIQLNDRDHGLAMPEKGGKISVQIGYKETGLVKMGDFFIDETGLSGPPDTLSIQGDSADFMAGMKEPRQKNWDGRTLGEIVDTIAAEVGFQSMVQEELRDEYFETLSQDIETYNQFLYRISERMGAVYKPNGSRLVVIRRDSKTSQSGKPLGQIELSIKKLVKWDLTLPDKAYYQNVRTWWYDEEAGKYNELFVTTNDSGGAKVTDTAPNGSTYTFREYFEDEEWAAREAHSMLQRLQKKTKQLTITTIGHPNLLCEVPVRITGGRSEMDQEWIVGRASHILNAQGYITECTLTPYVPYK